MTLTLLDGKQVELAPWSGSAEHFVGPDMAGAIDVLKDLCAEMDRRYGVLLSSGLRKIERGGDFGLHVVAIDELAFYMRGGTKDERTELSETLRDLISRGRAAGMIVIAATQKPSNDIVPTFVRDLFSFRMALRCTTPEASDTILGQGWAKEGYSASTLDPTSPGRGVPVGRRGGPAQGPHPLPRRRRHRRAGAARSTKQRRIAVRSAAEWRSVLAEVDQAGLCAHPVRLRGVTLDRSTGELAEGDLAGPLQGPTGRRVPLVLAPLPSRRLAARGRRHPGRQGRQPERGRPPPAVRDPDRTVLRAGAPDRRLGRWARTLSTPAQRRALPPRASALVHCCATAKDDPRSASRCAPSASTTAARCCGTPTSRGSGAGPATASTARWPRPVGLTSRAAALGGPTVLHQGGRVPGPRARPPPRRAPGRRRGRDQPRRRRVGSTPRS